MLFQGIADMFGEFPLFFGWGSSRLDGWRDDNVHFSRVGAPVPFLQNLCRSPNRDRQDGSLGFKRDEKESLFKRLKGSIRAARSFREDHNRYPFFNLLGCLEHAAVGLFGAVALDGNIADAGHGPSQEGDAEQFRFGGPAELDGEVPQKGEDVEGTLMVRDQDITFFMIKVFQALNSQFRSRGGELNLAPETGDKMGNVSGGVKEGEKDRDRSQDQSCAKKDQPGNNRTNHGLSSSEI